MQGGEESGEKLPPITLLRRGKIIHNKGTTDAEKKRIDNMVAIDYLTEFIAPMVPIRRGERPIKKPKGPGDKILLIKAGTASGKSTVIPPYLYKKFFDRQKKEIVVIQPRVINATDISLGLPEFYPYLKFGQNLGYQTGPMTVRTKEKGVMFVNIDTFYAIFSNLTPERILKRYQFIVLDEVHVREIALDSTLFLIKKFLQDYWDDPECPIILLMSATFNTKEYADYLSVPSENIINISGMSNPIQEIYPKYTVSDYKKYAYETIIKIHESSTGDASDMRDILLFVNGLGSIKEFVQMIHDYNAALQQKAPPPPSRKAVAVDGGDESEDVEKDVEEVKDVEVKSKSSNGFVGFIAPVSLTSSSFKKGGLEYQNLYSKVEYIKLPIFPKASKGDAVDMNATPIKHVTASRRLIISTNVAETGVTFSELKYCVDTGWAKETEFNPNVAVRLLLDKNVTKGAALQRKGRVGRKAPGVWYPCYTKESFESFADDAMSKLITDDISTILLTMIIKSTESKIDYASFTPTDLEKEERGKIDDLKKVAIGGVGACGGSSDFNENGEIVFRKHSYADKAFYKLYIGNDMDLQSLQFMETPSARSLIYSSEKLFTLGFIDNKHNPTEMGLIAYNFKKLSLENTKMILAGYANGCNIMDLVTIAAFIQVGQIYMSGKYKLRNIMYEGAKATFFTNTFIGDEFIDLIFLWDEFMEEVAKSKKDLIGRLKKWCNDNKLKYETMMMVIETRDQIMDNMLETGMNLYYNGLNIKRGGYNLKSIIRGSLTSGLDEIKKIKKSVLSGYRLNLLVWNEKVRSYVISNNQVPIVIKSPLIRFKPVSDSADMMEFAAKTKKISSIPEKIVISSPLIKNNFSGKYELANVGFVSIMDGFVDVDMSFLA